MPTLSFWRFCYERRKRLAVYVVAWALAWFVIAPRLPPLVGFLLTLFMFAAMGYQHGVTVGSDRMLNKWIASDQEFAARLQDAIGAADRAKEAFEQAKREQENAIH